MLPPPLSSSPPIPLSYDPRPPRAFSDWRRAAALAIDVAIFAPIIAVLCVAGSFDTESSHKSFSWFYVLAPFVYPLAEMIFTRTPGVWILGGRLVTPTGAPASAAQMLKRTLWKWGPFIITVPLLILSAETIGEKPAGFVILPLLVIGMAGTYLFLFIRANLRDRHTPWFDQLAGTRLARR